MKKVILACFIAFGALHLSAQKTAAPASAKENKIQYSVLWGLFKSKDYSKEKAVVVALPAPPVTPPKAPADTTQYEMKSALWGAIQWTAKKKADEK